MEILEHAEEEFTKKIVDLSERKAKLEREGGLINKLRKMACSYDLWFYKKMYEKRRHLLKVQKSYEKENEVLIDAYAQWYNVTSAPSLSIEEVKRLLD